VCSAAVRCCGSTFEPRGASIGVVTAAPSFEQHRDHLTGLAYRMLGSVADAEDMVQDTFVRWKQAGRPEPEHPRAWFAKVCTRLCLDRLKSAQRQRERYVGVWLPDPLVPVSDEPPRVELDESVSIALLHMLERLSPAERATFILKDVFDYSFDEVADVLERSSASCRKLASRARRHLDGHARVAPPDRATLERVSRAFFHAIESGDVETLRGLLSEEVVFQSDGGGKAIAAHQPIPGVDKVLRFLERVLMKPQPAEVRRELVDFNGAPGVLLYIGDRFETAFQLHVDGERVVAIYAHRNPDKLRLFGDRAARGG
jgi:RNA polymerase sigma-70 factor, ECF subfamily